MTFSLVADTACNKLTNATYGGHENAAQIPGPPDPPNGDVTGSSTFPGLLCPAMDASRGSCTNPPGVRVWRAGPLTVGNDGLIWPHWGCCDDR